MKPYGVKVIESPDIADIGAMAAKSSTGRFPGRSGEYRGYCRNKTKATTRRYWARKARRLNRDACNED